MQNCLSGFLQSTSGQTEQFRIEKHIKGTWVAQSVEYLTPDFGSGHDLMVCEFKPHIRLSAVSTEPAVDPLSSSLSLSLHPSLLLSKTSKHLKNIYGSESPGVGPQNWIIHKMIAGHLIPCSSSSSQEI